jgi:hypothetical protein
VSNWTYEIESELKGIVSETETNGVRGKKFFRIRRTKLIYESWVYEATLVFNVNKSSKGKAYPFFSCKKTGNKYTVPEMVRRLTGMFSERYAKRIVREAVEMTKS